MITALPDIPAARLLSLLISETVIGVLIGAMGRMFFLALQFMGLVAPPAGAGILLRIRGILILIAVVLGLLALGLGLVELISLPFGGVSLGGGVLLGFLVVAAALGVMALLGRRRQQKARAERAAASS